MGVRPPFFNQGVRLNPLRVNMKNILVAFGAVLLIIAAPFVFRSLYEARMDTYSQSFSLVTTGVSETSANVSLGLELYNDSITNVDTISSNISGDSPTAAGYTISGKVLNIGGLIDSSTRTLTVNYSVTSESLADIPAPGVLFTFILYLYIFAIIGLVAGTLWNVFR